MKNLILRNKTNLFFSEATASYTAKHPKDAKRFSQRIMDDDKNNNWCIYDNETDELYQLNRITLSEISEDNISSIIMIPKSFSFNVMSGIYEINADVSYLCNSHDANNVSFVIAFFNSLEDLKSKTNKILTENFYFYKKTLIDFHDSKETKIEPGHTLPLTSAVKLLSFPFTYEFKNNKYVKEHIGQMVGDHPFGWNIDICDNIHLLTNAERTAFWKIKKGLTFDEILNTLYKDLEVIMMPLCQVSTLNISTVSLNKKTDEIIVTDNVSKETATFKRHYWEKHMQYLMKNNDIFFEFYLVEEFNLFSEEKLTEDNIAVGDILTSTDGKCIVLDKDFVEFMVLSETGRVEIYDLDMLHLFKKVGETNMVNQLVDLLRQNS